MHQHCKASTVGSVMSFGTPTFCSSQYTEKSSCTFSTMVCDPCASSHTGSPISASLNKTIISLPLVLYTRCGIVLLFSLVAMSLASEKPESVPSERALTYVFGPVYLNSVPSFVPEAGTQNGMVVPAGGTMKPSL